MSPFSASFASTGGLIGTFCQYLPEKDTVFQALWVWVACPGRDELEESGQVIARCGGALFTFVFHALACSQARSSRFIFMVGCFFPPVVISYDCCPWKVLSACTINSSRSSSHRSAAVTLKTAFLPLVAFEIIVLIDNFRMCRALLPGDDDSMSDEAIWETLPHFWVAISMVFFVAATLFTLLKLCGDVSGLGWWDLFINFGIAECFAFLVCTKWSNPVIHGGSLNRERNSSSTPRYLDWNSGLVVSSEDHSRDRRCSLQDIGGHFMKIPIIAFQILLCMKLEATPPGARHIPIPVIFSPIFMLQGVGVMVGISQFIENVYLLLRSEASGGMYFAYSSRVHDFFAFLHCGSRLLGWWSLDEISREEQARLFHGGTSGYNTFSGYPPEIVKKMPKKDLAEEVWRLQAALGEQTGITKFSQQEYERLQHEKIFCRVCFEGEISIVLLPCRHRVLCSTCSGKCKECPICRGHIEERLLVYDV